MENISKPRRTRRRLDEQAWQAVLKQFDGAALTVEAFCHREGLTRSSFARWRARLRTGSKRMPARTMAKSAALAPKPSFVDLGLLDAAAPEPAAQHGVLDLRIELGGGLSLHLVRR